MSKITLTKIVLKMVLKRSPQYKCNDNSGKRCHWAHFQSDLMKERNTDSQSKS